MNSEVAKALEAMTPNDRQRLAEAVGLTIGQFIAYRLMRRWGAPKWAAYAGAVVQANLAAIHRELKRANP